MTEGQNRLKKCQFKQVALNSRRPIRCTANPGYYSCQLTGDGCSAHPFEFKTVGHCTGDAYSTVWFGEGFRNEDIEKNCPGYKDTNATKKDIEEYISRISPELKEWLKKRYEEEGVERMVL